MSSSNNFRILCHVTIYWKVKQMKGSATCYFGEFLQLLTGFM